ncbi:MAG: Rrf2 family transcriptional regulator [Caldiserica bacterium]|nr:Rrf2 family transcriptional regulator [Caldisericota bacterium]
MIFSARARYSVRAILYLASRAYSYPITTSEISREEEIPKEYLERLLNHLKKKGLVKSFRGRQGGYMLSRSPDKITIEEILQAVGEDLVLAKCLRENMEPCQRKEYCLAFPLWKMLREKLVDVLKEVTVRDLVSKGDGKTGLLHNYTFQI